MARTLRYLLVLLVTVVVGVGTAYAQTGEITGRVVDKDGEPLINAAVEAVVGGIVKAGIITDYDGNYIIKPIDPGRYDVRVQYAGKKTSVQTGVIVSANQATTVNFKMEPKDNVIDEVVVKAYKVPLVDPNQPGGQRVMTSEQLEKLPTRNTTTMVSTTGATYQSQDGAGVQIGGARGSGTLYYVDGVQVVGSRGINLPQDAIDQVQVLTSGLPAKYGDALGGVVNITTKGVSKKLRGGILLERSVDGYGHNLASVNLSGPLVTKTITDSVAGGVVTTKKPVMGFFLAGDVWYDQDRDPSYNGNYAVNDDVLNNLKDKPLVAVPNQNGVPVPRNASEFVTKDDLYITKKRQNAEALEGRVTGRLDFQLADNLNLSAGGNFNYVRTKSYSRAWSLFSPEASPIVNSYTGRGYLRLTQRFGKPQMTNTNDSNSRPPVITNAFYTLQLDYQKDYQSSEHPDHGRNIFKYGYVGKFYTDYVPIYGAGIDSVSGLPGIQLLVDRAATTTRFERSELNPLLANYTSQYYDIVGSNLPPTIQQLRAQNGLANGDLPISTYGLFTNVGQSIGAYSEAQLDQFSVTLNASFDLQLPNKPRHAIEFGLYYQQRTDRGYSAARSASSTTMWQYMRQLVNSHISLDNSKPIYLVNGNQYTYDELQAQGISPSPYDTILYARSANAASQSVFDRNLRSKIGAGATDYINVDELDPNSLTLDMFSADELLNSGNPFVSYRGYSYTGDKVNGQVNFNDFFTKKDANGNYTRDIGAFRPNYIAGYVLDRFQFKDIKFNVGVRLERFDANTKMLKDPYSLYEVNTLSDAKNITDPVTGQRVVKNNLNGGIDPANIGDDYVVYVNNNESSAPAIIGYRNGDDWYDPYGNYIEDPTSLKQFSGGRDPQPYLVDSKVRIQDSTFNPNSSFTDYKPQVNVMPRLSFQFPISDVAQFYAHYDVLVERPSNVFESPATYYFLTTNNQQIINNPGLKPQKMFDYEVGFTQQLTDFSALTLSGFYKERKDMIQVRPYLYAWPTTYYTYGNRDFSTTKGLVLRYDLRRKGNIQMDVSYTLQFAEGTGSGTSSANGGNGNTIQAQGLLQSFIAASRPNQRFTMPLNIDSRHNIVATVDYRFVGKNKGPVVGGKHILENAGVNMVFRTRSGEPYTSYQEPLRTSNVVEGAIQSSRLPWHYWMDLRVDKDFVLDFRGKKDKSANPKPKRALYVNAYVLIQNVLNTRDILSVDGYTSRPDDDGYLASPIGIQNTGNQLNGMSYMDLYTISLINPNRLNLPRRVNVGLQFNF